MAYLYVISTEEGVPLDYTWSASHDEMGEDSSWQKFCNANEQPEGPGRFMFIILAKQAGYKATRYWIPDDILREALHN